MSLTYLMSKPYVSHPRHWIKKKKKDVWQDRAKDRIPGHANRILPPHRHQTINQHWFNERFVYLIAFASSPNFSTLFVRLSRDYSQSAWLKSRNPHFLPSHVRGKDYPPPLQSWALSPGFINYASSLLSIQSASSSTSTLLACEHSI